MNQIKASLLVSCLFIGSLAQGKPLITETPRSAYEQTIDDVHCSISVLSQEEIKEVFGTKAPDDCVVARLSLTNGSGKQYILKSLDFGWACTSHAFNSNPIRRREALQPLKAVGSLYGGMLGSFLLAISLAISQEQAERAARWHRSFGHPIPITPCQQWLADNSSCVQKAAVGIFTAGVLGFIYYLDSINKTTKKFDEYSLEENTVLNPGQALQTYLFIDKNAFRNSLYYAFDITLHDPETSKPSKIDEVIWNCAYGCTGDH